MKKILSLLLSISMLASMATLPVKADETPIPLNASRIDAEKLPNGNLIYMGTASANVKEEDVVYSFPIYREGDLSDEASVTIHSLDLTAVYGEDYILLDDNVEETGDGVSILERYATAESDSDETQENTLEENTVEEISPIIDSEISQQFADETVPQAMEQIEYSSSTTVTFAPGENEKTVKFKILDDKKSEGTEGFSLLLVNPQNADLYEVTSLSVNIEDDEPKEKSTVSFSKSSYKSKDGTVTVTIKRNSAEYSLCDFALLSSSITATAGENYEEQIKTVTFMPYETEKTIDIPVSGEGEFKLLMSEMTGCEVGKYGETVIKIKEYADTNDEEYNISLMGSEKHTNTITINGQKYNVEYTMPSNNSNDPAEGKIYATGDGTHNYDIPPEVGKYYFATDVNRSGLFTYGDGYWGSKPWGCGFWKNQYEIDTNQRYMGNAHYGKLEYYHTSTWKNGGVWTYSKTVPSVYYQYMTPDWESTSGTYGGQLARFKILNNDNIVINNSKSGQFGRTLDAAPAKLITDNNALNGNIKMEIHSSDEDGGRTPKNYIRFYGVAAMYKKANVTLNQASEQSYKVGNETVYAVPMQFELNSGAQISGSKSRDFWTNPNEDDCNIVFTINDTNLNGHKGKYGYISGYKIDIDPGLSNDKVSLNYPEDFVSYLNSKKGTKLSDEVNFTSENVAKELKKTEQQNLYYIPFDKYFISWIESHQKNIVNDGYGYHQNLKITPKVSYADVTVEVLSASGEGNGSFTSSELVAGTTKTYHAGDTLDLSATSSDDGYHVVGYQVSTNNTNYNTITDTTKLFLEPNTSYKIRPVIAKNSNKIEIKFENGAEKYLTVQGLISENDLNSSSDEQLKKELSGKYVLNANPEKSNLSDKITPITGQIYTLNFTSVEDKDYIYRPVIKQGNDTFTTNSYHTVAQAQTTDNVITVNYKKIKKSDLKSFNVSGTVVSKNASIRDNGLEPESLPLVGYSVSAGKGSQVKNTATNSYMPDSATGTTADDGTYTLTGVLGSNDDLITMYISNGVTTGYVAKVKLSDALGQTNGAYTVNAGNINITYPYGAPKVSSIMYSYDKNTADLNQNQVRILDDNIKITAVIDSYGRSVSKAIFTVRTSTGQTTEFTGLPREAGSSIIECTIPKMTENLHSGDSLSVRLVDSEKLSFDGGEIEIVYPDVSTGLSFYTEFALSTPQTYDMDNAGTINVPLIGSAIGQGKSGLLTFGKTNWPNNTGYTIQVNVDTTISNSGSKTAKQKKELYDKFHAAVNEHNNTEDTRNNAMKIISASFGNGAPNRDDYESDAAYQQACTDYTDLLNDTKDPLIGFNSKKHSVEVAFVMAFDFVKTPDDDYMFACGSVAIGGAYTFNKTMYTTIYGVPVFLNIIAGIQANGVVSYVTSDGKNALSAGDFNNYQGNIANRLSSDDLKLSVVLSGKLQVGVGLCNVISARGYVSTTFQFDLTCVTGQTGELITAVGGVGFDLLLFSVNVDVAKYTQGWGTLEHAAEGDFFNGLISVSDDDIKLSQYNNGTADLSTFGQNNDIQLTATEEVVDYTLLLANAPDRTRAHIIPLDDGKKMITFIGNGIGLGTNRDENNAATLFYSIYDGNKWSTPTPVADDGTIDSSHTVKKIGNKVLIAWTDVKDRLLGTENSKEKLSSIGISCAIYDTQTNTMSDEIDLVHDKYLTFNPQINVDGDMLYISYIKLDTSKLGDKNSDLLQLEQSFSNIAFVKYDMNEKKSYDETIISIPHETLHSPVVLDYNSATTTVNNESYLISSYTIDEDEDLQSGDDRELYLQIQNLSTGKSYFPIRITNDDIVHSLPKLSDINGTLYLTWLDNGYMFKIMNVSDILSSIFNADSNGDMADLINADTINSAYKDGAMTAENENAAWYKKTAAELGMSDDVYENSIYEDLYNGTFKVTSANFQGNDDLCTNIGNYIVASNGEDIYVYYTELSQDNKKNGTEIYGVRYQRGTDNGHWKFGNAVQITDFGKVIDELDLYMTADNKISAVSNYYEQWTDDNDAKEPIKYSKNNLVTIDFEPISSLEIKNNNIILPSKIYPNYSEEISFSIANTGLLDAKGYDLKVTDNNGNTLYENGTDTIIESGNSVSVRIPWTVPNSLENAEITVTVTERGVENAQPVSFTKSIPYDTRLDVSDFEIKHNDNGYYAVATVKNNGSKPSDEITVTLNGNNKDFGTTALPQLAGGESKDITIPFEFDINDFNNLGYIDLSLSAVSGENKANTYTKFISDKPLIAQINDGAESISLNGKNDTKELQTKAFPWNNYAGEVKYYSTDNSIAVVTNDGKVIPTGNGNAKIYAYYPKYGIDDSIDVEVTGIESDEPKPTSKPSGGSGGSSSKYGISASEKSYDNGSMEISKKNAALGEKVTVNTKPNDGYEVDTVTVTDSKGNTVDVSKTDDNEYSFVMPGSQVNVDVTFKETTATPKETPKPTDNSDWWFDDVSENEWYYNPIKSAYDNGLMTGVSDTEFAPNTDITRGMFITVLHRIDGETKSDVDYTFSDVNENDYFANAVAWGSENDIISGYSDTEFAPNDNITREQMAAILLRYAEYKGIDTSNIDTLDNYSDTETISDYAVSAFQWACGNEIISGFSDNTLRPKSNTTRAQAAVVFDKINSIK